MTDFRRYQPRHARVSSGGGQSWWYLLVGILVIVMMWWIWRGGDDASSSNSNQAAEIRLRNDATANANQSSTDSNGNVNVSASTTAAPDASGVNLAECSSAVSHYGTRSAVALTYNLAADNDQVQALLKSLSETKTPASFFSSGTFAGAHSELMKQLSRAGYGVYNRSYDNPHVAELSAEDISSQLNRAEAAISQQTGQTSKPFFRPPFGETSEASLQAAAEAGYCTILWTVDGLDWQSGTTANAVRDRVVAKAKAGMIVMLSAGYDVTNAASKLIIESLKKDGYTFVTLSNLFTQ